MSTIDESDSRADTLQLRLMSSLTKVSGIVADTALIIVATGVYALLPMYSLLLFNLL